MRISELRFLRWATVELPQPHKSARSRRADRLDQVSARRCHSTSQIPVRTARPVGRISRRICHPPTQPVHMPWGLLGHEKSRGAIRTLDLGFVRAALCPLSYVAMKQPTRWPCPHCIRFSSRRQPTKRIPNPRSYRSNQSVLNSCNGVEASRHGATRHQVGGGGVRRVGADALTAFSDKPEGGSGFFRDRGGGQRRPTARRKSCPVSADCGPDPRRASRRRYRGGSNPYRHRRAKTGPRTLRISEAPRSIFLLAKSTAILYLNAAISLPPRFMAEHENNGTKSQQPNMPSQHVTGRFHKLLCELHGPKQISREQHAQQHNNGNHCAHARNYSTTTPQSIIGSNVAQLVKNKSGFIAGSGRYGRVRQ